MSRIIPIDAFDRRDERRAEVGGIPVREPTPAAYGTVIHVVAPYGNETRCGLDISDVQYAGDEAEARASGSGCADCAPFPYGNGAS